MLVIGKVGAPLGVQGHNRLVSYSQPPASIANYPIHCKNSDGSFSAIFATISTKGHKLIIKFLESNDRDQAALLVNKELYIEKSALEPTEKNEFYWHQLNGMSVQTEDNQYLGKVTNILDVGAKSVLVLDNCKTIVFDLKLSIVQVDTQTNTITAKADHVLE